MTMDGAKKTAGDRMARWLPAVFFLAVFAMYLTLMLDPYFTDEQDVFYGGYNIAMGSDLYSGYATQHMPFSYYMAALPALLGARTVYQFRLGFYGMMSLLWTGIFLRHRKALNIGALFLMPFLALFQLRLQAYATTMISDHWQGIGLAMILLEVIRYSREHRISVGMAVSVSAGIVLSFGTTFLSAYPLLIFFLGFVLMQVLWLRKHPEERKTALREDGRLVMICLFPFAVLLGWYAVSGNLGNFIGGAYTLNVQIYSKYIGGMGTAPGSTFLEVLPRWFSQLGKGFSLLGEEPMLGVQTLLQAAAVLCFAGKLGRKDPVAGITAFLGCVYAGVRVFDGFHGAPYMVITSVPMAFLIADGAEAFRRKKTPAHGAWALAGLACLIFFLAPSVSQVKHLYHVPRYLQNPSYSDTNRDMLEILTDPGDRVHVGDISFTSGKIMAYGLKLDDCTMASGSPWFYEYYGEKELEILKENKTKILLLETDGELWGFRVRDYAAPLVSWVEENYVMLEQDLYVHRDALEEAQQRLRAAGYGKVGTVLGAGGDTLGPMLWPGETDRQYFAAEGSELAGVWIRMASYMNSSRVGITLEIADVNSGEVLASVHMPKEEMRDLLYTRFPLQASLTPGKTYVLNIIADHPEGVEETRLHLFHGPEGSGTGQVYAVQDGESMDWNWVIQIEYGVDDQLNILGAGAVA